MKYSSYTHRFLKSTRGQIILLLRKKAGTVAELAAELELTDNAVRAHLATLERDGLVLQSGERAGLRKPHFSYELTPEAEDIFPKAYGLVLDRLLDTLKEHLSKEQIAEVLRQVGQRLASDQPWPTGSSFEDRLAGALKTMEGMGGQASVEREDGRTYLCGAGCPLSVATAHHIEVCDMLEELLAQILGTSVRQECRRGPFPQCRFKVAAPLNGPAEETPSV